MITVKLNGWDLYKIYDLNIPEQPAINWLCAIRGFYGDTKLIVSFYNTGDKKVYLEIPYVTYSPGYHEVAKIAVNNLDGGYTKAYRVEWENPSPYEAKQIGFHVDAGFIEELKKGEQIIIQNSKVSRVLSLSGSRNALNTLYNRCGMAPQVQSESITPNNRELQAALALVDKMASIIEASKTAPVPAPPPPALPPSESANISASNAKWYMIPKDLSKCQSSAAPAVLISELNQKGESYNSVETKGDDNELLRVTVTSKSANISMVFYRSLNDCQEQLKLKLPESYR